MDDSLANSESSQSEAQLHPRRSQRINSVVWPADNVVEPERLRKEGSRWGIHDLQLLKVNFVPEVDSHLSVLDVDAQWTVEQRKSGPPFQSVY